MNKNFEENTTTAAELNVQKEAKRWRRSSSSGVDERIELGGANRIAGGNERGEASQVVHFGGMLSAALSPVVNLG